MTKTNIFLVIVLASILGGGVAIDRGLFGQQDQEVSEPSPLVIGLLENKLVETGQLAPDFRLNDLNRQSLQLSELRGSPVVMNFFASWCAPCKVELPFLRAAHEKSAERGYTVLGVSNNDRREAMEAFALDEKLTYPIVIDGDNTVGVAYQVVGPPYTYFIDRAGVVVAVVSGELDEATLEENLTLLLN